MAAYFTPDLFVFLRELRANNDREWFHKNKGRYEKLAREPALRFIADAEPGLKKISRHVVADARPVGGSLFRINRDIRFSADKSPYKTAVGMSFGHDRGRDGAAPGFYLHLQPDDSFVGGGIHMADTATLTTIRDAIVARTSAWKRIVESPEFAPAYRPMGEGLKRVPAGYDANHPFADDLKRKSFTWHDRLTEKDVCAGGFMERFLADCRAASPFTKFLAEAVGAAW